MSQSEPFLWLDAVLMRASRLVTRQTPALPGGHRLAGLAARAPARATVKGGESASCSCQ